MEAAAGGATEELMQELLQASKTWEAADDYHRRELEHRQFDLSLQLLQHLRQHQLAKLRSVSRQGTTSPPGRRPDRSDSFDEDATAHPYNVRSLLGRGVSSRTVMQFTRTLVQGMSHRVEADELLPLTYDEEANRQALKRSAISLTRLSLASAELYAQLLAVPGAYGAGFVDLEALQVLAALLQRWETESKGNEPEAVSASAWGAKRPTPQVQSRQAHDQAWQPEKRSRQGTAQLTGYDDNCSSDSESEDDESSMGLVAEDAGTSLTPSQLLTRGLQVAAQVALIPSIRDFLSWSDEAKEVIISSVFVAMTSASALQAHGQGKKLTGPLLEWVAAVVSRSTSSLTQCVPSATSESLDSGIMTQRLHASKAILRGLHPLLLFQINVPLGAKGKQAAADVAGDVLQKFIAGIASDLARNPNSWPQGPLHVATVGEKEAMAPTFTPSATPGKVLHTPKTTNKNPGSSPFSNRRLSISNGKPTTPLRLKSSTKSIASRMSPEAIQNGSVFQGRPVLRETISLLHRLVFDPVLETSAAVRAHSVKTVHQCVRHFPTAERRLLVESLINLTRSKWWYSRQVACEVAVQLLLESWIWEGRSSLDSLVSNTTPRPPAPFPRSGDHRFADSLLECIVERLDDKERNIRISCANGITSLLQALRSETASQLFQSKLANALSIQASNVARMLRENCLNEDKALAKKASIGALVELLVTSRVNSELDLVLSHDDIVTLCCFCQDKSQETSKAAAEALTTLLETYQRTDDYSSGYDMLRLLERSWTESVLPLAMELESRMVAKLQNQFDRVVFCPIVDEDENYRGRAQTAWRIAGYATTQSAGTECLSSLLRRKVRESPSGVQVIRPFINSIMDAISSLFLKTDDVLFNPDSVDQAQMVGVWCLLKASLASVNSLTDVTQPMKKNPRGMGIAVECFENMVHALSNCNSKVGSSLCRSMGLCLDVIGALAPQLGEDLTASAAACIEHQVRSFCLPKPIIGAAINALLSLTAVLENKSDPDKIQQLCRAKVRTLFQACEDAIATALRVEVEDDPESCLVRALFMTGELCLVGFSEDEDGTQVAAAKIKADPIIGIQERPSTRLEQLVHAFLPSTVPNATGAQTPSVVRSVAFLTLGKMCVRNEVLTVKSVNLFARELHEGGNGSPDVQSNVLLVFGDLCVRYANHVDRFLPLMARCLQAGVSGDLEVLGPRNDFSLVRVQAVHLLSNLIMQDYIKWRGLLFHRFLVATADDDEGVASEARNALCGPLLTKRPQLFVQNFVESLFVLNRCTTHPMYKAAAASGDGGSGVAVDFEGIHLNGLIGSARRHHIYKFMLSKLSDEQKVSVTARIAKEVLGNALEHDNDLQRLCNFPNPEGLDLENHPTYAHAFNVLRDALTILRSKLIRVSRRKEGTSNVSQQSKVDAIKGELLSNINRTQLVEIIIPILVNLKATLQSNRSPLLKDLMGYLLVVYESYPDKVKDFLSNEPQLLMEIEHDARTSRRSRQMHRDSFRHLSTSAD